MTRLNPHGRACFSDAALKAFREFVRIDNATVAQRPRGAQDAQHPKLTRALARDRKLARDDLPVNPSDMNQPLPAHVKEMCDAVEKAGGDVKQFEHFLHSIWPGIADFRRTLDDELDPDEREEMQAEDMVDPDEPDSANPNAWQGLGGRGTEGFDKPARDNPPPFPGMPMPGGKMVPKRNGEMSMDAAMDDYFRMFPDARRIKEDPCVPMSPRSANIRPVSVRPTIHGLAMDNRLHRSSDAEDYAAMFGTSQVRVL